jgi:Glycogen recognition site of AMP-activated protein kinase
MNDRIQLALDGELAAGELTREEQAEVQRYRAAICMAIGPTHRWPTIDVSHEVMRRVAPGPMRRLIRAALTGLWSPRSFSIRPVYGMAATLALAAVVWLSGSFPARSAAAAPARMVVQFRVSDPEAHQVALVGDFNGWRPAHQLRRTGDGVWTVDVALEPGVYNYVFLVDGTTVRLDPLAPRVTDGFGGASSRVAVFAPGSRS